MTNLMIVPEQTLEKMCQDWANMKADFDLTLFRFGISKTSAQVKQQHEVDISFEPLMKELIRRKRLVLK